MIVKTITKRCIIKSQTTVIIFFDFRPEYQFCAQNAVQQFCKIRNLKSRKTSFTRYIQLQAVRLANI